MSKSDAQEARQMMKTTLVIDCSNLCYKSFYAIKDLTFEGVDTSVLFGFFRDIALMRDRLMADTLVFCFDKGKPIRKEIDPDYKSSRGVASKFVAQEVWDVVMSDLRRQIELLRTKYLAEAGFTNILWQEGYEADDIIASVAINKKAEEKVIIISGDKDMYQLLRDDVIIFNHNKKTFYNEQMFLNEWLISPKNWADAKAIAGDPGDDIEGLKSIGLKTAIKWMRGEVNQKSKVYAVLVADQGKTHEKNILLTKIPYPGTKVFKIISGMPHRDLWNGLMDRLGMPSLKEYEFTKKTIKQKHREENQGEFVFDETGEW